MATGRPAVTSLLTAEKPGLHVEQTAHRLYARAAALSWFTLGGRLSHRPLSLQVLEDTPDLLPCADAPPAVRTIPIAQVVGSVERARSQDFDAEFRPRNPQLKDRWLSVAARRQAGRALPPVDLVQVGERYFVVDGHHRISVDRALGYSTIQAHVTRLC